MESPSLKRNSLCLQSRGVTSENLFRKKTKAEFWQRFKETNPLESSRIGVISHQGGRNTMEDCHRIVPLFELNTELDSFSDLEDGPNSSPDILSRPKYPLNTKISFISVCDGHGGTEASDFVNQNLFSNIIHQKVILQDPGAAILAGFEETEEGFQKIVEDTEMDGLIGSTATILLFIGNNLYIANVGDSEAVLSTKKGYHVLTKSHIPSNKEEQVRIEDVGGVIVKDKCGNCRLGHPIWNSYLVNIGVTRAFGDAYFKNEKYLDSRVSGMNTIPSMSFWELTMDDEFIIVASDGFWDTVNHEEAVKLAAEKLRSGIECEIICKELCELSSSRGSKDNITIILMVLKSKEL